MWVKATAEKYGTKNFYTIPTLGMSESKQILKLIPEKCPGTDTKMTLYTSFHMKQKLVKVPRPRKKWHQNLGFIDRDRYSRRSLISDHLSLQTNSSIPFFFSKLVCFVGNRLSTPSGQHLAPALYPIYYNPRFQK